MHENDIIHRDIKPDNVLFMSDLTTVKLVDFGISEQFTAKDDDSISKSAGSPAFMAPELCAPEHGQLHGFACDIWSMGTFLPLSYPLPSLMRLVRIRCDTLRTRKRSTTLRPLFEPPRSLLRHSLRSSFPPSSHLSSTRSSPPPSTRQEPHDAHNDARNLVTSLAHHCRSHPSHFLRPQLFDCRRAYGGRV